MAHIDEVKARIARVANGASTSQDWHTILSWVRFSRSSNHIVKDLGHFDAHRDERDRGVTTERARDYFTVSKFALPGQTDPWTSEIVREVATASLRLQGPEVGVQLGIPLARAIAIAVSAAAKVDLYHNGEWFRTSDFSHEEQRVMDFACTKWRVSSIFTPKEAIESLADALHADEMLEADRIDAFLAQEARFANYICWLMHGSSVQAATGDPMVLACCDDGAGNLTVYCTIPYRGAFVQFPTFITSNVMEDWCTPALAERLRANGRIVGLEILENGLLAHIGG